MRASRFGVFSFTHVADVLYGQFSDHSSWPLTLYDVSWECAWLPLNLTSLHTALRVTPPVFLST